MKPARHDFRLFCLAITLISITYPAFAQTTVTYPDCLQTAPQDPACLAQRFRPYLKFTIDNGKDEQYRPASWQWLVQHSDYATWLATDIGVEPVGDWGPAKVDSLLGFTNPANQYVPYSYPSDVRKNYTDNKGVLHPKAGDVPNNPSLGFNVRNEIDSVTNQLAQRGQSWEDVKSGNGLGGSPIYAHVEPVAENPDLVNIEYIILFAFNHGINNGICQFGADVSHNFTDHMGDLTFINLVYCKSCDQIIRASFSAHGIVLQAFDLMSDKSTGVGAPGWTFWGTVIAPWWNLPQNAQPVPNVLSIKDDPSWTDPFAVKKVSTNFWFVVPGPFINIDPIVFRWFFVPDQGGNHVYFVKDPISNRFEHIAVFLEWGSHELYPNATGDSYCLPKHSGNGTSFLPDKVTYLGTMNDLMSNPDYAENAPFVFFNGKWASDPQPPIMHKTWYYPDNRGYDQNYACADDNPATHDLANDNNPFGIRADRFADVSPYHLGSWNGAVCIENENPWVPWPPVKPPDTAACDLLLKEYDPPTTTLSLSGLSYSNGSVTYVTSKNTDIWVNVTNPAYRDAPLISTYVRLYPAGMALPQPPPFTELNHAILSSGVIGVLTLQPPDGAYVIEYYSTEFHNSEPTRSAQFTLDTTPPTITITEPATVNYPHNGTLTLNYAVSDGQGSGVRSFTPNMDGLNSVSGQGLQSGQSISLAELSLGAHTFSVYAVDNLNNASGRSVGFSIVGPTLNFSALTLSFVNQLVGTASAPQSITLTNTGNASLNISNVGVRGDFAQKSQCGSSLGVGANCTINVTYTPTIGGPAAGLLTIQDDAPGSPHTVALSGTGQDFSVAVASSGSASATVAPGQSATYNLSFLPLGGFKGTLSLTCQGAILQATCMVSPASLTLNGSSASTATVTVTTTAGATMLPAPRNPLVPPGGFLALRIWIWALLALTALVFATRVGRHQEFGPVQASLGMSLLFVALTTVITMTSCNPVKPTPSIQGTPIGTYNLNVSSTFTEGSAMLTHNITLTLNVK